ncbi:hypothetical protein T492DRAFT_89553 [Pavlovales sp. CCMP2436]|nr:hypothetical protein T492DRAFT_89553 [Pavlovales sp. CCMP2436]
MWAAAAARAPLIELLGRRAAVAALSLLLLPAPSSGMVPSATAARPRRIDSHLHLWSSGVDWNAGQSPPAALRSVATIDRFVVEAKAAGIEGALIVQHTSPWTCTDPDLGLDHSYAQSALGQHPDFFRAMAVADPRLGTDRACAALEQLKAAGFSGVRFNAGLFPAAEGMGGPTGRALFAKAGELGMPVGVMAFGGAAGVLSDLRSLLAASSRTVLIVDHFGFFRHRCGKEMISD